MGGGDFLFRMRNSSHSSPPYFLYREMVLGETRVRTPNKDARVRTPNKDGHRSGLHIQMVTGQGQRAVHMVRDSISGVTVHRLNVGWSRVRDSI